jgi:hypothetical protein
MILRIASIALLMALFAPSVGVSREVDGPISVTGQGWSQAPTRWSIAPDGSIVDIRGEGQTLTMPMTLATRKTIPAPERYRRIQGLLASARAWVRSGKAPPCKLYATDATVGQIRWGAEVLAFYTGCGDPETQPLIKGVVAADALIKEWVADAPVTARRELKSGEDYNAAVRELNAQ